MSLIFSVPLRGACEDRVSRLLEKGWVNQVYWAGGFMGTGQGCKEIDLTMANEKDDVV